MKLSYAPPETLVKLCMGGYDPQFMFLMSKSGNSVMERVKGLLVFNQDSGLVRKPDINESHVKV